MEMVIKKVDIYTPNNGHNGTDWRTFKIGRDVLTYDDDFHIIEGNKIEKIEVVSDRHVKITCAYETLDFYGVQFETFTENN